MAIRLEDVLVEFIAASADYPGGSFKDTSLPSSFDGSELAKVWTNDIHGFFQKLILNAGITPSGAPDTVLVSDYFKSLSNMIAVGNYAVDTGAVNAYVIAVDWDTVDTGTVSTLLAGSVYSFLTTNANTIGAPTLNVNGLGVVTIKRPDGSNLNPDDIAANKIAIVMFDGTDFILLTARIIQHNHKTGTEGGSLGQLPLTDVTLSGAAASPPDPNTLVKDNIPKAWINFDGTGAPSIRDSYNVSSIIDNGVGNYTVNWDTDFDTVNYAVVYTGSGSVTPASGVSNYAVGSIDLRYQDSTVGTNTDSLFNNVIAFGDQ